VSALSGPCAKYIVEYEWTAEQAFERSAPFEDLVAPADDDSGVLDLNLHALPSDLREFLLNPQTGARQVARRFFAQAAEMRFTAFAAATSALAPPVVGRVFEVTPLDHGHFGLSYYDHILRGLRFSLPDEVRALVLNHETVEPGIFAGLGGVAVVHL
jgi:hypothetical protein